jgi:hypothetical protein
MQRERGHRCMRCTRCTVPIITPPPIDSVPSKPLHPFHHLPHKFFVAQNLSSIYIPLSLNQQQTTLSTLLLDIQPAFKHTHLLSIPLYPPSKCLTIGIPLPRSEAALVAPAPPSARPLFEERPLSTLPNELVVSPPRRSTPLPMLYVKPSHVRLSA